MRNGICPKCSSTSIHVSKVAIPLKGLSPVNALPISYNVLLGGSTAPFHHYVCVECGYVEQYVEHAHKLREIAAKLPRVRPEEHSG